MSLAAAFLRGLAGAPASAFADDARLDALLIAAHARARTAWPAIHIPPERFAAELARRLGEDATIDRLAAVRAEDVYLAIACCDGDAPAITACVALLTREVEIAAQRTSATPAQGADVGANLRRILFVDEPPRYAALREFSGRGDLRGYLRVMATRDLVRAVAKGRREVTHDSDDLLERIVPAQDPELSVLRAQYREDVDAALRAAIASLDERGRALLRFHLVEKWTLEQVARAYDVHRATAARWLADVRRDLGERIRAELAKRLEIGVDEVDSIVRLVRSRVDVSLDRILGPADAS
jgi:RNA polymerase sigma-70 factor, ECF subfamily